MKRQMKPGNMVYPVPAALVSCADNKGNTNLITVAWTGTVCSDPPMLYISVRPERYSHHMIGESREFVLNLTTERIIAATDTCGVRSGRDTDKWKLTGLTPEKASLVAAPLVAESPVNIECRVTEILWLGSHDMFLAEVVAVDADERLFDADGSLKLEKAGLAAYSHGSYRKLGEELGTFGYSVRKKETGKCSIAKKCGGCRYCGVPYPEQLKIKQNKLEKLLGEFGKVEPVIGMENPDYYRNKVHHVFDYDRKRGIISGCYEEGTHKVVAVDDCRLEDRKSQEIMKTIRELCRSFRIKTYDEDTGYGLLRHVLIRRGFTSGEIMVVLVLASQILPGKNNFIKALTEKHPEITTVVLNVNAGKTSMVLGDYEKPLYGPGFIRDMLCGYSFRISPKSFYQVNPVQTQVLYDTAIRFAGLTGRETVIDAYCGTGTIGICASGSAKEVIGVELNPDAVRDAKLNVRENRTENVRIVQADATDWICRYEGKADVIFMDPPRTGSTAEFIRAAAAAGASRIVYVSCGPDSLARDLKEFSKEGYQVRRIRPIDLFPYTEHCEVVVLLSKHG